jgi:glycosyltransferase involved in cell wall biosynthesis
VAANPAVAKALEIVRREFDLPAISHNHDFYWERVGGLSLTCAPAIELMDKFLPPHDPRIKHAVINSLAQEELKERKGIPSLIVPNVFDFESPPWEVDDYNQDLRSEIGLKETDLVILQATRIVSRKGIELAIDFARALNSSERRAVLTKNELYDGRQFSNNDRIILVLAGYTQDDLTHEYKQNLIDKADQEGVSLFFIEDRVCAERTTRDDQKIYSLWDTYTMADLVTYPSLWEGWGNEFLEAIKAKLPIVLFEYPVFKQDIKAKGFNFISLGDRISDLDDNGLVRVEEAIIENAADQALIVLTDPKLRSEVVENNYSVAREYYSVTALGKYIDQLF